MVSYVTFSVLCIWITGFVTVGLAFPWVDPSVEALDELHDAEIYKAVVTSVSEWKQRQAEKKSANRFKREDSPVACYKDLGCFEASGPFGYLDTLPDKPEDISTKFLMFPGRRRRKRGSPPAEVPFEKLDEAFEWAKDGFNGSLPTKVLIHGFGSDCNYIWVYEIRSALMAVEEVNIICVDWSNGAALPNYVKASANTRLVGKQLSLLLRGLVEKNGLSLKKTHIIGFSLGAHIAAFAGADLGNLSRITGLDPAGPLFESQDPRARLDQSDAEFVDVIHSNGENLILGGLGSSQPMGHVDFYPNGGRMQKGCSHLFVGAVSDIIWSSAVEGRSLCNHRRAYKFFIDSVSPRCHFPAFPCDSHENFLDGKCFPCTDERQCGNMGYYADRSKGRGQLYLITRDEEPFCAHQYHVKLETSPSPIPVKSYGKIQITLVGESSLNETFVMTKIDDEELKLGESISKILVPHPILAQPVKIEILYTAYSGWLSSGLTQWSMDKVTLMDSFGKTSSVCKKNLILQSGKPVLLPLYPGECNLPKNNYEAEAQDRMQTIEENITSTSAKKSNFIPTQVVKIGLDDKEYKTTEKSKVSFKNAIDFFNIPWRNDEENDVIDEAESSRAFNTRVIKSDNSDKSSPIKEIVEPILKPHSNKNGRSHDPKREKEVEITEPLLGPTSEKPTPKTTKKVQATTKSSIRESKPSTKESDWVPKKIPVEHKKEQRKRQDESRILSGFDQPPNIGDPIEAIANTVQFLPQRLARMFEQAERYARETILPLVSTYTPRFITDIIVPKESTTQKYVPLKYEEPTTKSVHTSTVTIEERNLNNKKFDPPPSAAPIEVSTKDYTTPFTNIQKIRKKGDEPQALPEKLHLIKAISKEQEVLEPASSENRNHRVWTEKPALVSEQPKRRARDDLNAARSAPPNPVETIINVVQEIPENIGKALQQAEKFAKDNVLPFVSNLTPRFIIDFFNPKQKDISRIIPFTSEETIAAEVTEVTRETMMLNEKIKTGIGGPTTAKVNRRRRNKQNDLLNDDDDDDEKELETSSYTNIQRIPKKKH